MIFICNLEALLYLILFQLYMSGDHSRLRKIIICYKGEFIDDYLLVNKTFILINLAIYSQHGQYIHI